MEQQQNEGFSYTYSAKEQAEIRRIREKYTAQTKEESNIERLRRLDAQVTRRGQIVALTLGILGALILGFGMSLIMTELRDVFALSQEGALFSGILIGVIGGILVGIAYPLYHLIVKTQRKRIAPEILRLTDELMK